MINADITFMMYNMAIIFMTDSQFPIILFMVIVYILFSLFFFFTNVIIYCFV